jgi:D-alanyl-D-alanine dipeptidase
VRADARSRWQSEGSAVPAVIGRRGLAWGVGFEPHAAPDEPRKREGDGRSPAGVVSLDTAFGFAPADSAGWLRLPYLPLSTGTECVDDTASVHYNQVVERGDVARVDWQSAERMRQVQPYRLGFTTGYNTTPHVKARGSCIFFHIWSGPRSTTAGCTALAEGDLRVLMAWLDPRANPVAVQLPAAVHARLREAWGLPALDR